jgi:hypothetical protein
VWHGSKVLQHCEVAVSCSVTLGKLCHILVAVPDLELQSLHHRAVKGLVTHCVCDAAIISRTQCFYF